MNKSTKTLVTILAILLIVGLAFYPKIKKLTAEPDKKEAGKDKGGKGGPGGKGGKTAVVVTDLLSRSSFLNTNFNILL